ncbi:hypothetical protein Taro_046511 [Colocasia esculenta]|uniref:Peptide chain release factor domain-containing protein n=1 Tax=Colocasia esculenta TaxID=4460 RepID=A0A843WZ13_COLES|nr:hypothetical protein [Colocasia esculenta]
MATAGSMSVGAATRLARSRRAEGRGRVVVRSSVRASQSLEDKTNRVFKELGYFSLKKKIEDAVVRAQVIASTALKVEEARRIALEDGFQQYNLWDDIKKSTDSLRRLSTATKVVDALKDLQYKAEEAKLITELADMDIINHQLFKQAYNASLDMSKFLDWYEMSKLLTGRYDKEGACVTIRAEAEDISSQVWAEKILRMYTRWSEKHGYKPRVVEKIPLEGVGIKYAAIEFELEYVYGYLSGEAGVHRMIRSSRDGSIIRETCSAVVDVIPIFLESTADVHIEESDLEISSTSSRGRKESGYEVRSAVSIRHTQTDIIVHCSDERSHFANKMKALNRLKAKLLVIAREQGVAHLNEIKKADIINVSEQEDRIYAFRPHRLVQDMKTGVQLPNLHSALDGNIDPLIRANICMRRGRYPE